MKCYTFFLLIFVSTISCSMQAIGSESIYPPILDFYPNCSYETIKIYSAKRQMDDPSKQEKVNSNLLLKIRKKAVSVGADAVILVTKKTKRKITPAKVAIFTIKYEAELIKLCIEDSDASKRLTAYNHLGSKTVRTATIKKKNVYSNSHIITYSNVVHRPKIVNQEVSLKNGVYGVKLGDGYQHVIDFLGTPNTIINMFIDELIIGYGRKHWLHFQDNKLVKVKTNATLLSQSTINKIPFIDFFDDSNWKINDKVTFETQIVDVNKVFETTGKLNKKHHFIIENDVDKLTLYFSKHKSQNEHGMYYVLNDFSLERKAYTQLTNKLPVNRAKHFNVLKKAMASLNEKKTISFETIKPELGRALGFIKLSKQEQLIIYNNNLFLQIRSEDIKNITLLENIFQAGVLDDATDSPWYLGDFIEGQSIEVLRKYFPIDSFELDEEVEIDSDKYQLSLLFDEINDESLLYEATMILY